MRSSIFFARSSSSFSIASGTPLSFCMEDDRETARMSGDGGRGGRRLWSVVGDDGIKSMDRRLPDEG
jgi:hypothetical protein